MTVDGGATSGATWARYLLLVVIVVAVVTGVALLPGVGVRSPGFRIVVVVGLIVLLIPVQTWGIRQRVRRLERRLDGELAGLSDQIQQERATTPAGGAGGATDDTLLRAETDVARARDLLHLGDGRSAAGIVEELARETGASWAADAPVRRQLARCARTARTLAKLAPS